MLATTPPKNIKNKEKTQFACTVRRCFMLSLSNLSKHYLAMLLRTLSLWLCLKKGHTQKDMYHNFPSRLFNY